MRFFWQPVPTVRGQAQQLLYLAEDAYSEVCRDPQASRAEIRDARHALDVARRHFRANKDNHTPL